MVFHSKRYIWIRKRKWNEKMEKTECCFMVIRCRTRSFPFLSFFLLFIFSSSSSLLHQTESFTFPLYASQYGRVYLCIYCVSMCIESTICFVCGMAHIQLMCVSSHSVEFRTLNNKFRVLSMFTGYGFWIFRRFVFVIILRNQNLKQKFLIWKKKRK